MQIYGKDQHWNLFDNATLITPAITNEIILKGGDKDTDLISSGRSEYSQSNS